MIRFILFVGWAVILTSCGASKIKIDDQNVENAMVEALKWQEANPIFAKDPTDWTNGAYYTGVARAHESTGNPIFLKAIKDMGERNDWETWERFYHADDVAISYSYLYLNALQPDVVDLEPTSVWIMDHLYKPHAWKDGTDPMSEKKILWWWCDALFMAPPVLVKYSNLTGNKEILNQMHEYYMETYNLLFDQEEKLFARDTRFQWTGSEDDLKEENGEKIFWSRGNGWVLGGLALILSELPKDWEHYNFYEDLYKTMAERIKELQPADGLWRSSLLSPESWNHGEVSGSGFYTFALTWGINNGILDRKNYEETVKKAWVALEDCQQPSGKVGWVQNIGASPDPASADSWQNYGTGAFLLAGSEILKL
ncbi:glycoside hydrolase family 88/105 protein [Portibacter marinus]|uniref:glycoside hydrolase family 88/105 protein n=1 Tax=Portibacter marinus TaxID=2898660 RepID=UPI001F22060D|nr:glycoside hydrolase family 88 protein [Portibacter marinus]